jgi:hypothetical protein
LGGVSHDDVEWTSIASLKEAAHEDEAEAKLEEMARA